MEDFTGTFIYSFISLFSMVNPIGMSAVFLSSTRHYPEDQRHTVAYLVALYGTILMISTFFIGPYVLRFFGITLPSIQIAGGMIVFSVAWQLLSPKPRSISEKEKVVESSGLENAFFPLTMPMTAGAGSIAVMLSLAANIVNTNFNVFKIAATVLATICVFIIVGFSYRYSDVIFKKLGSTGTNVVSRLTAFILLAISVTIIWEGVLGLVSSSAIPIKKFFSVE